MNRTYMLFVILLLLHLSACEHDGIDNENSNETESSALAPATLKAGDRFYKLNILTGKHNGAIDFYSDGKCKDALGDFTTSYTYKRLSDSTSTFSYTLIEETNLYLEYYTRTWKYSGVLTWSTKTKCKGTFDCNFSSTKFPSSKTTETFIFEYAPGNGSDDPTDDNNNGNNDNKYTKEFIQQQIKNLEAKKATAEKQLAEYLTWKPNATVNALIATQRQLISSYESQIRKWQSML